jgi:hypothetical protein
VRAFGRDLEMTEQLLEGSAGNPFVERPFTVINSGEMTFLSQAHTVGGSSVLRVIFAGGRRSNSVVGPRVAGGPPSGRGSWKIMLAERPYSAANRGNLLGEIMDARSRRLTLRHNGPATFSFTLDGDSPMAHRIRELEHEVLVWRWDDRTGRDRPMVRAVIAQSQDVISPQVHSVNYTAHDYLKLLERRSATRAYTHRNVDQDDLAGGFLTWGQTTSNNTSLLPGGRIPVLPQFVYPDGAYNRPRSGVLRDRDYLGNTSAGDALDNLANVINGFDYCVTPEPPTVAGSGGMFINADQLRIFYPYRGVVRSDWGFVYGSTVSSVSRSINSAAYGNYVRVIGQSDLDAPQVFAESWSADAHDIIRNPAGLWPIANSASDVTEVATLREKAAGLLEEFGTLIPAYSLGLRPDAYHLGAFDIGDAVPLQIRSGRLDVDTFVRVFAITYVIGDDGEEDIEVEVGRPEPTFLGLVSNANQRISALERR